MPSNPTDNEKKLLELKVKLAEKTKESEQIRKEFESDFQNRLALALSTALGVVIALFWQTAITDTLKAFIPVTGAWPYELAVALIVTVICVVALVFIQKKKAPAPLANAGSNENASAAGKEVK